VNLITFQTFRLHIGQMLSPPAIFAVQQSVW
jgi:hypothetical protein